MRYEVLIMLAVVGAINLVGRVLAKRAQSKAPVAPAAAAPPVVSRSSEVRAPAAAAPRVVAKAPAAPAARRAMPKAAAAPAAQGKPRNRWNARTLRRAFVAGEILGTPVGQRH